MKFLVLALCVCAASAATFTQKPYGSGAYRPFQGFKNTPVAPAVTVAKTVASVSAPVVEPAVAIAAAPFVATAEAGATAYQAAKQVVSKTYATEGEAAILRSESEVKPDGYNYVYETANGISSQVTGQYKKLGEEGAVVSQGSYRYYSPDGTPVEVTFIADENGYQPQSSSLPVGPAIPDAILRSLAYIAEKTKGTVQKY